MKWLANLNKSWVHFLVLGIIFYQVEAKVFPDPKTVIGPLSQSQQHTLQQRWLADFGKFPTDQQTVKMIIDELDRDVLFQRALELNFHLHDKIVYDQLIRNMRFLDVKTDKSNAELFQEALNMRLHLVDEVIKRRLIENMKQRLLVINPPAEVSKEKVRAAFAVRKDEFYRPVRYSISHIFINPERKAELESVIKTIQHQRLNAATAKYLSSPFMSGYHFQGQTPEQLARSFGVLFMSELAKAAPIAGEAYGPLRSAFGWHYVWVSSIEPGRDALFVEVASQLQRSLDVQERVKTLQTAIVSLRANYEVRR